LSAKEHECYKLVLNTLAYTLCICCDVISHCVWTWNLGEI